VILLLSAGPAGTGKLFSCSCGSYYVVRKRKMKKKILSRQHQAGERIVFTEK
jgi:PhoH-like protein.